MKLSIIIPTYNRAESLQKTLQSILDAKIPPNLKVAVTVVNNNSTDKTESVVRAMQKKFPEGKLDYVFEARQGKSFALNTGIEISDGELFTVIDDDICVAEDWFCETAELFTSRWDEIDFAGGKILPNFEAEAPNWIAPLKDGVIGWREYGETEWNYDENSPMLAGGHAIIKRSVFDEIGLFEENLGPSGKNMVGCEDDIFYDKLLTAGKRGIYSPRLVFYHFVPKYRMSKSYYRQWCFGAGKSWHLMDKHYKSFKGKRLFGVPRYLYKEFLEYSWKKIKLELKNEEVESLASERKILVFAGYFYARNLQDTSIDSVLSKLTSRMIQRAER